MPTLCRITCKVVLSVNFFNVNNKSKIGYSSLCVMCTFIPQLITHAERRNTYRNKLGHKMSFNITVAFLQKLKADTSSCCAISGVEFKFCPRVAHMASLDCIVDKIGYIDNNVRFLDIRLNTRAKWTKEK